MSREGKFINKYVYQLEDKLLDARAQLQRRYENQSMTSEARQVLRGKIEGLNSALDALEEVLEEVEAKHAEQDIIAPDPVTDLKD